MSTTFDERAERLRAEEVLGRDSVGPIPPHFREEDEALAAGFKPNGSKHSRPLGALRAVNVGELVSMELPPRRLLLAPWLPSQGLAFVYAWRGVGKTHFALQVAFAVATGGEFLSWRAETPARVLYLDGEMPAVAMQERLASIIAGSDRELDPGNFMLLTNDLQEFGMPNLASTEGQELVQPFVTEADLVVIDNLATLIHQTRENGGEDWLAVQGWLLRLRAAGKSVLLVHHAGKSGAQRGWSGKEDILDTSIELRHPKGYEPERGAEFEVHFRKSRGFYGGDAEPLFARLHTESTGAVGWTHSTLQAEVDEQILDLLAEGLNQPQIAEELGLNKSNVCRRVKKLKAEGRLA